MKNLRKKLNILIEKQKNQHTNDPSVYLIWEEMTNLLSADIYLSIQFMEQTDVEQLHWISQVFDDIMLKTNSTEYLRFLERLKTKQLTPDMILSIDIAIDLYSES